MLSTISTSFATIESINKENVKIEKVEPVKLKKDYTEVNGIIMNKNGEIDTYAQSVNYLVEAGLVEVKNNKIFKISNGNKRKFDFYAKCIDKNGEYYKLTSFMAINENFIKEYNQSANESLNRVIEKRERLNKSGLSNDLSSLNSIVTRYSGNVVYGDFDYRGVCQNNTVELMYNYSNYKNVGFSDGQAWFSSGLDFVEKVRTGGQWDYKQTLGTDNLYSTTLGNYTGEEIGNMHYGTVGTFLFDEFTLLSAAGLYQIYSGTAEMRWFRTYFDDPRDSTSIRYGISIHDTWGYPTIMNYQY